MTFIYIQLKIHRVAMEEKIRCNICNIMVNIIIAKEHASLSVHLSQRFNIEKTLKTIRANDSYKHDNSVISEWKSALTTGHN
ncbi:MAG: hypothetical protein WA421_07000 [Nitrososphaeraceae archaeon]|jgi:hypothetical protein